MSYTTSLLLNYTSQAQQAGLTGIDSLQFKNARAQVLLVEFA
ncbi:hypothetical protein [Undibacterium curvum]